jgi:hypothetical protein
MKSKLRLLLFPECNRACEGCCNKDWDLTKLPVVESYEGYKEIMLTGGEPMLKPALVMHIANAIRIENPSARIILYTAMSPSILFVVLRLIDGVTITLHEQKDVPPFINLVSFLKKYGNYEGKSLRLNIFKGVDITNVDTSLFKVKSGIEWIKDCPLPEDEVFMRLA